MTIAPTWLAPRPQGPVEAVVRVPGSKSLTNRWLVLAALADGPSRLRRPLASRDTERMVDALRALGVQVDTGDQTEPARIGDVDGNPAVWTVTPPETLSGDVGIDCGQAGTVMRFLPPVAALARGAVRFDGHPSARLRPVGPVLEALRALGVRVQDSGAGTLPYTVLGTGSVTGGEVSLDASASSQFVSALLLSAARFEQGLTVRHTGERLPSLPHIDMTLAALAVAGIRAETQSAGLWRVEPGRVHAFDVDVEPDLSSAAPFLALAAVAGGTVQIRDWPSVTTQAGDQMRWILAEMGVNTSLGPDGLETKGSGELSGADLDLSEAGELTPVVAAVAVLADGPSTLRGVAHLRGHETDRLAALATEISRIGGRVTELQDGLRIVPSPLHGAQLKTYHDHRMAMFAAVVGAVVPDIAVEDINTTAKTYPGFESAWRQAIDSTGGHGAEQGKG